jgi:hypothetical protein
MTDTITSSNHFDVREGTAQRDVFPEVRIIWVLLRVGYHAPSFFDSKNWSDLSVRAEDKFLFK